MGPLPLFGNGLQSLFAAGGVDTAKCVGPAGIAVGAANTLLVGASAGAKAVPLADAAIDAGAVASLVPELARSASEQAVRSSKARACFAHS